MPTDRVFHRFRAVEAVLEETCETMAELALGRRTLRVEVARTTLHPPALRLSVLGPSPAAGYRRHEDCYIRSAEEFDALLVALTRARARLRELDSSADVALGGAIDGSQSHDR